MPSDDECTCDDCQTLPVRRRRMEVYDSLPQTFRLLIQEFGDKEVIETGQFLRTTDPAVLGPALRSQRRRRQERLLSQPPPPAVSEPPPSKNRARSARRRAPTPAA